MVADSRITLSLPTAGNDTVGVLFSGGRDSSLVAALLARDGWKVHLITCDNGTSIGGEVVQHRISELQRRFPTSFVPNVILPSYGLFRKVALVDIELDFAKYKKNLITLGSQLATHSAAAVYCLEKGIVTLASGFAKYQNHLPEQKGDAIDLICSFMQQLGIRYVMPAYDYADEDAVKYKLFEFGMSTKSLESTSIFSDTSSEPEGELVKAYISEKLPLCLEHVREMTRHISKKAGDVRQ